MEKKERFNVKVTAESIYRRKALMRIAKISVIIILLFLLLLYSVLYIVHESGYFTIMVDRDSIHSLVISPYEDFRTEEVTLRAKAPDAMDNISEMWLPVDINYREGDNSGDDYIAYTFFLRNDSLTTVDYVATIDIRSVTRNVDEAIRVKVYYNDDPTVYAKRAQDGNPEPGTEPFASNMRIMERKVEDFWPDAVDKYTVVIWLEGDDPECVDDIIGGTMTMFMLLKIEE